jgi:hypothetical protein
MQLPLDPLKLLLGYNCGEQRQINAHEEEFLAARDWSLRKKFELIYLVFVGNLVPSHSLCGL